MTTEWQIDAAPRAEQLSQIAATLAGGGVVLLPTDTVYGLHALAMDERAVARVAEIKGRTETKPFLVLASAVAQLPLLGISAPPGILSALETIWPAPLTVILPLREPVPASRGAATLAVRIPALGWLRELVSRTGPLLSTSANRSGEPVVGSPSALAPELRDALDGVVDGGVLEGEPSAILDLTRAEPQFIREGEFSFTQNVWKSLRKTP
jgi:L-threonylcarbamoyladenylate synthase